MIYIKLAENKEIIDKKNINFLERIKNRFVKIKEEINENKTLVVINDVSKIY